MFSTSEVLLLQSDMKKIKKTNLILGIYIQMIIWYQLSTFESQQAITKIMKIIYTINNFANYNMDRFNSRYFSSFDKLVEPLIMLILPSLVIQFHSPVASIPKLMSLIANISVNFKANLIAMKCQYLFMIRQHSRKRLIFVIFDRMKKLINALETSTPKSKSII